MVFSWILFLVPFTGLLYTAYLTIKDDRLKALDRLFIQQPVNCYALPGSGSHHQGSCQIKWISSREFERILLESEDVIVIDLRSASNKEPVPYPVAHVLPLALSALSHILKWLPPATNVVLYGDLDLCPSALWAAHDMTRSTPVYVFAEAAIRSKAETTPFMPLNRDL